MGDVQNGLSGVAQSDECLAKLGDLRRRKTGGRLVENQQAAVSLVSSAQRSRHGYEGFFSGPELGDGG